MNLVWNILTTLGARITIIVLSLISSVVLARILGPDGRGVFALVFLLPELARMFGLLGIEQSNAVYAGLEPKKRATLVWHSAFIAATVGGLVAIAGVLFITLGAPGFPSLLRGPLWIYWIPFSILPFALASDYFRAILRGMNRIFVLNVLDVGIKISALALLLVFVGWLRLGVAGAVWAEVVTQVAVLLIVAGLLAYGSSFSPPAFDRSLFRRSARFALPAHGHTLISYLNYRIDQIFIAAWLPPEELGYYVVAVSLAESLWIPTGAVANALLPHITNSTERNPALPAVLARHVMIWVGVACVAVFVLADIGIEILYSSSFSATAAPLRWLLPGIFALSGARVLIAELLAREKPQYMALASGGATLMNIAGNFLLVPFMGITGAAIASSISYSLLAFLLVWFYLRETGLRFSVLLPHRSDLVIYTSLRSIVAGYWQSKVVPKASDSEGKSQSSRHLAPTPLPRERENKRRLDAAAKNLQSIWLQKIRNFCAHPHFPYFVLVLIRKISPTLARYLQYGRFNPNTEEYWNERYRSNSYQIDEGWKYQSLDNEIINLIAPGSTILDAGCGTGRIMEKLRDQKNCGCVGVDISGVAISHVRARGFRGFKCALPDLASDLSHESFDVCTMIETLEHLSRPQMSLQRLSKVLRDGGSFIVSVPDDCMRPDEFDEHVSRFDRQRLCDLLGKYCVVDRVLSVEAAGNIHLIARGKIHRCSGIESSASKASVTTDFDSGT